MKKTKKADVALDWLAVAAMFLALVMVALMIAAIAMTIFA